MTKSFASIPAPPSSRILGPVDLNNLASFHLQLMAWQKIYGDFYRLRQGWRQSLVISNQTVIKNILQSRPNKYYRPLQFEKVFSDAGCNGVFTANGDNWQRQRQFIDKAFRNENLKSFYPRLKLVTSRLLGRLHHLAASGESIDLLVELKCFAVDATISLVFGEDFNSIEGEESDFSKRINIIFLGFHRRIRSPLPFWRLFKTAKEKQYQNAHVEIGKWVQMFINKQRNLLLSNSNLMDNPENLLQALLVEQLKTKNLSDEEIHANCVTLLLAGGDTTANTLTWICYFVSHFLPIQQRLYQELVNTESKDGLYNWPLPKLDFVNAVMFEAMRLKPVAPMLALKNYEDEIIENYQIKKGTEIILLLKACGVKSQSFTSPYNFDPERWLKETDKALMSNMFPFGSGRRSCPGRWLALLEIRLVLSVIFRNFSLEPSQDVASIRENLAFTVSPDGFYCKVHSIK